MPRNDCLEEMGEIGAEVVATALATDLVRRLSCLMMDVVIEQSQMGLARKFDHVSYRPVE